MLMSRNLSRTLWSRKTKKALTSSKNYSSNERKKIAVVLSGSGMLDGTEIHEAAAVAVHFSRLNVQPVFYAPPCPQGDVVDHVKKCPVGESRVAMVEAARIARGNISPINDLQHCHAGGVVFPGGFGAAKTLSTYAEDKENFAIAEEVMRVMEEFASVKKPMAFLCIAAMIPAKYFSCCKITLGRKGNPQKWPHADAIEHATQLGAVLEEKSVDDLTLDRQRLIFSTPAFMYEGQFYEIFDGIGRMVTEMYKLMD